MIVSRMRMVFSENELSRISVQIDARGEVRITADVHGMKCSEARRFIKNIINIVRMAFQLVIVHGYNHGTAIKDMLAQNFNNSHIFEQFPDLNNQGVTHMLIAA